eukprot:3754445-Rhodomonas_salina.1
MHIKGPAYNCTGYPGTPGYSGTRVPREPGPGTMREELKVAEPLGPPTCNTRVGPGLTTTSTTSSSSTGSSRTKGGD